MLHTVNVARLLTYCDICVMRITYKNVIIFWSSLVQFLSNCEILRHTLFITSVLKFFTANCYRSTAGINHA